MKVAITWQPWSWRSIVRGWLTLRPNIGIKAAKKNTFSTKRENDCHCLRPTLSLATAQAAQNAQSSRIAISFHRLLLPRMSDLALKTWNGQTVLYTTNAAALETDVLQTHCKGSSLMNVNQRLMDTYESYVFDTAYIMIYSKRCIIAQAHVSWQMCLRDHVNFGLSLLLLQTTRVKSRNCHVYRLCLNGLTDVRKSPI